MRTLTLITLTLGLMTGCASQSQMSLEEKNQAFEDYIASANLVKINKVNTFRFNGWQSLGGKYLILRTSPKRKYLVEIAGFCPSLTTAMTIIVNQHGSNVLTTRFDSISVANYPENKCPIQSIYALTSENVEQLSNVGKEKLTEH